MQHKHYQVHQHRRERDASQSRIDRDALGIPQKVTRVSLNPSDIDPDIILAPANGLRNPRLKMTEMGQVPNTCKPGPLLWLPVFIRAQVVLESNHHPGDSSRRGQTGENL